MLCVSAARMLLQIIFPQEALEPEKSLFKVAIQLRDKNTLRNQNDSYF